ncbi:MAG: efflux RND transporter periplasmic adaptor subunit [Chitinophagales bacterium]|nr:efflux RND transporter periplasmic adaptor subunit [Chitinophagales bacterium]
MKKKSWIRYIMIIAVVLLLAALIANRAGLFGKEQAAAGPKGKTSGPAMVQAQIINTSTLQDKILTTGSILANEEVDLTSEASGKIVNIFFKEGSKVSKGTLLVKINDSDLQAQLKQLSYNIKQAEDIEYRQKQLFSKEAISREEYDRALTSLNSLRAQAEMIQSQIAKTEIRAPFSGTIGLRYVSEGAYIGPSTKVARLINTDPLKIEFTVPERYGAVVKKGSKINFFVEGMDTSQKFTAEVYAVEPSIEATTRTLRLRALYHNKSESIFPGQFARIELVLKEYANTIQVNTEALIPELGGQKVFLVKDGKAESVKVSTGIRTADKVQITAGLNKGDTLVTSGVLQLRPGTPVKVQNEL